MREPPETIQFLLKDILDFHAEIEKTFLMEKGIHDKGLLESAIHAPFQTFGGHDLYPDIITKAARLCFGLVKDHPFRDGNKRTALHSMLVFLAVNDLEIEYTPQEIEDIILAVADGSIGSEALSAWLKARQKSI
ncbi:MAG: type II toxin-antitoxin system death-on-curing family toxin [Negativicutes bacterium]